MSRLFRSEVYKLRTTPGPWILIIITLALTALGIITSFLFTNAQGHTVFTAPSNAHELRVLMGAGYAAGIVLAPVLGVICITGEYRHKVLSTTLLVSPKREQVIVAKVLASVLWAVMMGVFSLVLVAAMGIPLLVVEGGSTSSFLNQVGPVVPGLLGAYALLAVYGMGIGTLIRNQVGGVIMALGLTLVLEPILVALFRGLLHIDLNWLPSRATSALAGGLDGGGGAGGGGGNPALLLSWWLGGLALLGWGVGLAVVGYFTTFRRDVT